MASLRCVELSDNGSRELLEASSSVRNRTPTGSKHSSNSFANWGDAHYLTQFIHD